MKKAFLFLGILSMLASAVTAQNVTVKQVTDSTWQIVTEVPRADGSGSVEYSRPMKAEELKSVLYQSAMQADAQKSQVVRQAQATYSVSEGYKKAFEERSGGESYRTKVNKDFSKQFRGTYRFSTDGNSFLATFDGKNMFFSSAAASYPFEIVNPQTFSVTGLSKEGAVIMDAMNQKEYIGIADGKKVVVTKISDEVIAGSPEVIPEAPKVSAPAKAKKQ